MKFDIFSNPYAVIIGLMFLVVLVYFWNKRNSNRSRERRQRTFRERYHERRRQRGKTEDKLNQKDSHT